MKSKTHGMSALFPDSMVAVIVEQHRRRRRQGHRRRHRRRRRRPYPLAPPLHPL